MPSKSAINCTLSPFRHSLAEGTCSLFLLKTGMRKVAMATDTTLHLPSAQKINNETLSRIVQPLYILRQGMTIIYYFCVVVLEARLRYLFTMRHHHPISSSSFSLRSLHPPLHFIVTTTEQPLRMKQRLSSTSLLLLFSPTHKPPQTTLPNYNPRLICSLVLNKPFFFSLDLSNN